MSELKLPRLLAAAKEFNVGQDTLIDFLVAKGFDRENLKPTAKVTLQMYEALEAKFAKDLAVRRIQRCIATKSPYLDIGRCGLTDKDFEEGRQIEYIIKAMYPYRNINT